MKASTIRDFRIGDKVSLREGDYEGGTVVSLSAAGVALDGDTVRVRWPHSPYRRGIPYRPESLVLA